MNYFRPKCGKNSSNPEIADEFWREQIEQNDREMYKECVKKGSLEEYCFDTEFLTMAQMVRVKDGVKVKKKKNERKMVILDCCNKAIFEEIRGENGWWLNHPSINNPFKSSQLKIKKEWQSIKPELFIVTPVDCRDDIQMNDKYGDAEIFGSKGKIPKLYKDAPPGQCIFQTNKAISLFTKHESIRSKSKSKYESRVSKLKEEHFNPKITDIIEEPIPYHSFCVICNCVFNDYYSHLLLPAHIQKSATQKTEYTKIDLMINNLKQETLDNENYLAMLEYKEFKKKRDSQAENEMFRLLIDLELKLLMQ